MLIHDVATRADWEAACADPEVGLIRIIADITGPLVYTGRNGSQENTVLITSGGGRVFVPKDGSRGAIEFPVGVRGILVATTDGRPWIIGPSDNATTTEEADHGQ